jgi:excisionase family DNA binding protein
MSDKDTPGGALIHINVAAKQLGLSAYQIRGLVEKGEIPATRIGNRTYLLERSLSEYIERIAS